MTVQEAKTAGKQPRVPKYPETKLSNLIFPNSRYHWAFEASEDLRDEVAKAKVPELAQTNRIEHGQGVMPWIIQAPLNSVEVIEAILKPSRPLEIHTAIHVPRIPFTSSSKPDCYRAVPENRRKRLYREYRMYQGQLEEEGRQISYVCVPLSFVKQAHNELWWRFIPQPLHFISIPWGKGSLGTNTSPRRLVHPCALFFNSREPHGLVYSYEYWLKTLLERCGLVGCKFERSLLLPGTTPIPETLWDWVGGIPGKVAALPYYKAKTEEDSEEVKEDSGIKEEDSEEIKEDSGIKEEDSEETKEESGIKEEYSGRLKRETSHEVSDHVEGQWEKDGNPSHVETGMGRKRRKIQEDRKPRQTRRSSRLRSIVSENRFA